MRKHVPATITIAAIIITIAVFTIIDTAAVDMLTMLVGPPHGVAGTCEAR
jgi:hypothetical protein